MNFIIDFILVLNQLLYLYVLLYTLKILLILGDIRHAECFLKI